MIWNEKMTRVDKFVCAIVLGMLVALTLVIMWPAILQALKL